MLPNKGRLGSNRGQMEGLGSNMAFWRNLLSAMLLPAIQAARNNLKHTTR